jgi:hypothetical protein
MAVADIRFIIHGRCLVADSEHQLVRDSFRRYDQLIRDSVEETRLSTFGKYTGSITSVVPKYNSRDRQTETPVGVHQHDQQAVNFLLSSRRFLDTGGCP